MDMATAMQQLAVQGAGEVVGNSYTQATGANKAQGKGTSFEKMLREVFTQNGKAGSVKTAAQQLMQKHGEENAQELIQQLLMQNPMLMQMLMNENGNAEEALQMLTQAIGGTAEAGLSAQTLQAPQQTATQPENTAQTMQQMLTQLNAEQVQTAQNAQAAQGAQQTQAPQVQSQVGVQQNADLPGAMQVTVDKGTAKAPQPSQAVKLFEQGNVESAAYRTRINALNTDAKPEPDGQKSQNEKQGEAPLAEKAEKTEQPKQEKLPEGAAPVQESFEKTLENVREATKNPMQITGKGAEEVMRQTISGLKENVNAGKEEFVMRLKPEGLGEITVKLESIDGKTTLQLTAQNQNVQRLLTGELEALKQAVKPYNVEVREITVSATQQSESFTADTNAGSQQQQQQQLYDMMNGRFSFGQGSNKGHFAFSSILNGNQHEAEIEDTPLIKMQTSSAIDTYI